MDEQQISELVKEEVAKWFESQQSQTNGYEYEKTFVECWRAVGQKVFQQSLGKIPGSKNEKKTEVQSGRGHRFQQTFGRSDGK
jgi:hypothetical protein